MFYIESVYFIKTVTKYQNCASLRKTETCAKIIAKNAQIIYEILPKIIKLHKMDLIL